MKKINETIQAMIQKIKAWWPNTWLAKRLNGPKRRQTLLLMGGAALLAVVALAASFFLRPQSNFPTRSNGEYQTEAAQIGTLNDTVSASGSVEAGQQATLNWRTTGIVEEVLVTEGDQVSRGDTLATLQLDSVPDTIISAQSELESAKQALQDFYDSFSGVNLAEAKQTLAEAQQDYEDALYTYNSSITPANDLAIENAYADVILAEGDMREALQDYKKYNDKPDYNINRINTFQHYYDLKLVYDAAVRTYNSLSGTGTDTQIAVTQAGVDVAEAAWIAAQEEYDRMLAGPTDEEIAAEEANVAAVEAKLNQRLVEAPFDGLVTLALPREGNYVDEGAKAFEMQNPSSFLMEVQVNEMDINKIEVGQSATVTLDALPEKAYKAVVSKVGSIGDNSSGVVNFTVLVEISEPDEDLKAGMTAVVEVATSSDQQALLIPNQAIRLEEGQMVVYVMSNGNIEAVPVTLGNSSTEYSELLEGEIQPGDLIVLNPPTAEVENNGSFFPGGGGNFQGGPAGGPPPEGFNGN